MSPRPYLHGLVELVSKEEGLVLDTLNWQEEGRDAGSWSETLGWAFCSHLLSPQPGPQVIAKPRVRLHSPVPVSVPWLIPSSWLSLGDSYFLLRCLQLTKVSKGLEGKIALMNPRPRATNFLVPQTQEIFQTAVLTVWFLDSYTSVTWGLGTDAILVPHPRCAEAAGLKVGDPLTPLCLG